MNVVAEMVRPTVQTGAMLPLLLRHKIQVLLGAGLSQTDVAEQADVSVDTVRRVKHEDEVTDIDDGAHRRARSVGRPSKAEGCGAQVRAWLAKEPCTTVRPGALVTLLTGSLGDTILVYGNVTREDREQVPGARQRPPERPVTDTGSNGT